MLNLATDRIADQINWGNFFLMMVEVSDIKDIILYSKVKYEKDGSLIVL